MALNPQTATKIGEWFNNYLQPAAADAKPESYFDDLSGGPKTTLAAPANPAATTSKATRGLLGSSTQSGVSDLPAPPTPTQATVAKPITEATYVPPPETGGPGERPPGSPPTYVPPPETSGPGEPPPPIYVPPTPTMPGGLLASDENPAARPATPIIGGRGVPTGTTATPPTPAAPTTPAAAVAPPVTPAAPAIPAAAAPAGTTTNANGVTTLNLDDLSQRHVAGEETVAGQMTGLLASNSDYVQGFRDRSMREANARGLVNSSIAAGAGEEAAAAGALPIASADAATFGKAADYNASVLNQGRMYNADAFNKMSLAQLSAETDRMIASMQTAASQANAMVAAAASKYNADMSFAATQYSAGSQERIAAEREAATTRRQTEAQAATLTQQTTHDHTALVSGILNNNDIPPERRAALLRSLGENGLADSIYVVASTTADLTNGGNGNNSFGDTSAGG